MKQEKKFDIDEFPAKRLGIPQLDRPFREIFVESALLFMSREEIAAELGDTLADLDRRCKGTFGMGAEEAIRNMAAIADQDARKTLRGLMGHGSATATSIYAQYIAKLCKDEESKASGINVVVSVGRDGDGGK